MNAQRAALTGAQKSSGEIPVALHIAGEEWLFSIASVKRIGRELFLQIALRGPALCSLTVHLRDRVVFGVTAPQILNAACDWLLSRGEATHGYVDLANVSPDWISPLPA
jgi:hypothetical protein